MDNESYNICLDLVEWFESICQTIPHFELSRNCFYINGKVVRIPSPGILRVTLREQASCLSLLSDLRRWIQLNIEYYSNNTENVDLNHSLSLLSEMLEREIEKDKYRSFFHGATNCSLKTNWYSGNVVHIPSGNLVVSKQSIKRKPSVKATVVSNESSTPSKKLVTMVSESPSRKLASRRVVSSDSEDDGDGDFKVTDAVSSESKRKLETRPSIRIKTTPSITEKPLVVRPVIASTAPPKPRPSVNIDPVIRDTIQSILQPLIDNKTFDLFVDPVPADVIDYYEFIENPLCLNDMIKKLNSGKYKKVSSIQKDIQLIVVNCIYYNMLNNPYQSGNRKNAYLLLKEFLRLFYDHSDKLKEQGALDEYLSLFDCYCNLIESMYAITLDDYQLIRYFAVDPKKLHDYDRFVKKPITLRAILTKLISLEYIAFDKIRTDFTLLFDNCIHYWRSYNYNSGKIYIDAAQVLKERFDTIISQVISEVSSDAEKLMQNMVSLREKRKQELLEKKKVEVRPSLLSIPATEEFTQETYIPRLPSPTMITRTSNRINHFENSQYTPVWESYANRCLDILKECVFPYWCWTLFLTPIEQLLKQPDYENEILTPITWMTIESQVNTIERQTFCGSMRLLFDNCLAYNQPSLNTIPVNWIRDPCKFLYNEFNLLWRSFATNPTPRDYQDLLNKLKDIRLDGFVPYHDFVNNPKNYYDDYFTITDQPMGFNDTLHIRGSFDDWCEIIKKVFNDAMKYHSNNRGSPFIAAEAQYLLSEFEKLSVIAKEVVSRGGPASDIQYTVEKPSTEGLRVYTVNQTHLSNDQCRKCRQIVTDFRKIGEPLPLFRHYMRTPSKNTINYLKYTERLVYLNDISRAVDANEYHNLEEFRNDFTTMMNNVIYICQGSEKEMAKLFTEFMKSILGDIYRLSRIDPQSGVDDFLQSNQNILNKLYQEEKIAEFFRSFKQECRNSYYLLNSSTLRTIISKPEESEVVITSEQDSAVLDRVLPIVSEMEENHPRNFWDFITQLLHVLEVRLKAAEEAESNTLTSFIQKAIQKTKEIFAGKVKPLVVKYKLNMYKKSINTASSIEKQRTIHRPTGNQVCYLNANQLQCYNTPSLYMLKVAKKVVLRELKPEIAEKEKKEETPMPSVKLKLMGKDVEKESSATIASIMTKEDVLKEDVVEEKQEEEDEIVDYFEV